MSLCAEMFALILSDLGENISTACFPWMGPLFLFLFFRLVARAFWSLCLHAVGPAACGLGGSSIVVGLVLNCVVSVVVICVGFFCWCPLIVYQESS